MSLNQSVLICDQVNPTLNEILEKNGLKITYEPEITPDQIAEKIGAYEVVVVRSRTKITKDLIQRADKCKIIARVGVGLDNIDQDAAKEKNIRVINAVEGAMNAVAELVVGLMLSLAREIPRADREVRNGNWIKKELMGTELRGKYLGIIGLGNIGKRLGRLAKSFNMNIDPHIIKYVINNRKNISKIYRYINFRYIFEQASLKKVQTDYPPYLLIEPVSTCNLRCPFCFQTDKSFTKKPFMGTMKLDLFNNIIAQANELGVGGITIASRGEPTLHKDLGEMLRYTKDKENIFEVKLNTNGTKLSEDLCYQIFESEVNQLVISADHYEKKTFEELRKNSNFEHIVKNVNMLFEIRKKFKNPITEIRVSGVDYYKSTDNEYDLLYIEQRDLSLDILILILTMVFLFRSFTH